MDHQMSTGCITEMSVNFFLSYFVYNIYNKDKNPSKSFMIIWFSFLKFIAVNPNSIKVEHSFVLTKYHALRPHVLWLFFIILISTITILKLLVEISNTLRTASVKDTLQFKSKILKKMPLMLYSHRGTPRLNK